MILQLKRVMRALCPPALWNAARSALPRRRERATAILPQAQRKIVSTLGELDVELAQARAAEAVSTEAVNRVLDGLVFGLPNDLPPDPHSAEYRERQMDFYQFISGRDRYTPVECEQITLSEDARQRPFPYYTRNTTIVGEQLMAMGFLIRTLNLPPGGRILELGPGLGRLTAELARMDFRITAVDVNSQFVDFLREESRRIGFRLEVVCAPMLTYRTAERFDRVVFYESFHHCDDPAAMVARFDELVAPGGCVVFGGEPIEDNFPMPWGVRRDGRSLWAIRQFGWLELGFRTDYFLELLDRHGWQAQIHASADVPWQRVFVARRLSEAA